MAVTCTAITFPIIPKVYSRVQVTLCADQSSSFTPRSVNHLFLHLILCTGELPVILEQKGILWIATAENPLIRSRLTHTFWPPCSVYATHTHSDLKHKIAPHILSSLSYIRREPHIYTYNKPNKALMSVNWEHFLVRSVCIWSSWEHSSSSAERLKEAKRGERDERIGNERMIYLTAL